MNSIRGPVIIAIVGLVGVIVGQVLTRSSEYLKWLRTERHQSCARLLGATRTAILSSGLDAALRAISEKSDPDSISAETLNEAIDKEIEKLTLSDQERTFIRSGDAQRTMMTAIRAGLKAKKDDFEKAHGVDASEWSKRMRANSQEILSALEGVRLIVPQNVAEVAGKLGGLAIDLLTEPESEENHRDAKLKEYEEARETFITIAQKMLFPYYGRLLLKYMDPIKTLG